MMGGDNVYHFSDKILFIAQWGTFQITQGGDQCCKQRQNLFMLSDTDGDGKLNKSKSYFTGFNRRYTPYPHRLGLGSWREKYICSKDCLRSSNVETPNGPRHLNWLGYLLCTETRRFWKSSKGYIQFLDIQVNLLGSVFEG